MFEVYGRHAPMFVLSEVKALADIFASCLAFPDADLREHGIEIVPVAQTVRVAEINQFVVKSALGAERISSFLEEGAHFQRLRDARRDPWPLITQVIEHMARRLGVDSSLCIGAPLPKSAGLPRQAAGVSSRPLVIFNAPGNALGHPFAFPQWRGKDHPALWIGRDWLPAMEGVEAFFAISPELKLEVALNRYQPLVRFGDFSFGMVRF